MGTRSTYRIINSAGKPIALVYLQFDGYPNGHPLDTAKWLSRRRLTNGFRIGEKLIFNGAGCLAAQLIKKYKKGPGGCYIESIKDRGRLGEEYTYDIIVSGGNIQYVAYEVGWGSDVKFKEIFRGTPQEYVKAYK